MPIASIFFIAFSLAMDAVAISIGVSAGRQLDTLRARVRLAFHFAVFQMIMTVLGWLGGAGLKSFIDGIDHWVALALLCYVGINMIRSGLAHQDDTPRPDPSRGLTMVMLSTVTSLDALAVGFSLAMLSTSILLPAAIMGLVTFALSLVGLLTGARLGNTFGRVMEVAGGIVLILIGLQVLITDLYL